MTKEITMKEAADEINRLNRERDALQTLLFERQAQLIEANNTIMELRAFAYERAPQLAAEEMQGLKEQVAEVEAERLEVSRAWQAEYDRLVAAEARADAAERIIEFKDKIITALETRAEAAEARADAAEKAIEDLCSQQQLNK